MAESFAQDPQERPDPNYIFWFRPPREQPRGSEAGKITGEEYGKLFHEGTTAADDYEKNDLQHQIYDLADTARSKFTSQLANILGQQQGLPDQGNPLDVLPKQSAQPPQEVKQGVQQVQGLQSSLDAGKITKLQYLQYLIPHIQDLRDTHQGYRPYIDQEVSKITGGDPANERINTLLSLVKEGHENRNREDQRAFALTDAMVKDGDPRGAALYLGYQHGNVPLSTIMQNAAQSFAYKRQLEMHRMDVAERQTRLGELAESRAERAEQEAKNESTSSHIWDNNATRIFNTPFDVAGHTNTPEQLFKFIQDSAASGKYDEKQMATLVPVLQGLKAKIEASAIQDHQFGGVDVKPAVMEANRKRVFDRIDSYINMISGDPKKIGMVGMFGTWDKLLLDEDKYALKSSSEIGDYARRAEVWKDVTGPAFANFAQGLLTNPNFTEGMWTYGLSHITNMMGQEQMDPKATENPFTFGGAIKATNQDLPPKAVPGMVKTYLNNANYIMDKDWPEDKRVNLARAFFADTKENRDLLSSFNTNSKWQVFSTLTSPKMTQEIVKLGNRHPEIAAAYVNTTHALFNSLMHDNVVPTLKQAEQDYGHGTSHAAYLARHGMASSTQEPINYKWDNENYRLGLTENSLAFLKKINPDNWQRLPLIRMLGQFNAAVRNYSHIAQAADVDPNLALLQILHEQGLDVDPETKNAVFKVAKAIASAHQEKGLPEDVQKEVEEDVSRNK